MNEKTVVHLVFYNVDKQNEVYTDYTTDNCPPYAVGSYIHVDEKHYESVNRKPVLRGDITKIEFEIQKHVYEEGKVTEQFVHIFVKPIDS